MTLYSLALSIHLGTLFLLIPLILYTDHLGFHWMVKKDVMLPERKLRTLHRSILVGLVLMIASGATLFSDVSAYLLTVPVFYIKMFFVLTLVLNSFFIGKLMRIAIEKTFREISPREKKLLFISGSASTIGWIGAILAATQLGL